MLGNLTGLALMGMIAVIGGVSLVQTDWQKPLAAEFEDGSTQHSLEAAFDDSLLILDASIEGWNALRFALFGETLPGAVPGKDRWLFTDEEYQTPADFETRLAVHLDAIIEATRALQQIGSSVIVVLVPDKARIMADKLDRARPETLITRFDRAIDVLRAADIEVIDPRAALTAANSAEPVYLKRDTHWSPFGASVVAREVGPMIAALTDERARFETTVTGTIAHEGDLMKFVDAGVWNDVLGLPPEEVEIHVTSRHGSEDLSAGLFGDAAVPATLIGTSYSAIPTWNFTGFLQQQSQTDILNKAEEGRGPFVPMDSYLAQIENGAAPSEIVIWEVPERYLTIELEE